MKSHYGQCDWCKELRHVGKLEYIDGKHHYSCDECLSLAKIDVRLFNRDELTQRSRLEQRSALG
ncbi:hypothetical protein ACPV5L_14370 [Vibrio astriarenae]|jgi:surfactin synthase thioesterase subunit|uniref:Uncharacterized protein n=1 Tax=Vibrio agarivorans TaxID=153622 RepID=A0ABT7Y064_9VIBR|nr:hypothetical protein [Vibrio agarivorans]MDN2481401.1 hypothetical protein [Vibrio agarivorans]